MKHKQTPKYNRREVMDYEVQNDIGLVRVIEPHNQVEKFYAKWGGQDGYSFNRAN